MSNFRFFVESKGDRKFLQDYIDFKYDVYIPEEDFITLKGDKTKIERVSNKFIEFTKQGFNNLLFLDANSNFQETFDYINKKKNELKLNFDFFIFPDNQNKGIREDLLLHLTIPEHRIVLDCYQKHIDCIKKHLAYTCPNQKSKVYAYIFCVLKGNERDHMDQGEWNYKNSVVWDLGNCALEPLSDFLSQYSF